MNQYNDFTFQFPSSYGELITNVFIVTVSSASSQLFNVFSIISRMNLNEFKLSFIAPWNPNNPLFNYGAFWIIKEHFLPNSNIIVTDSRTYIVDYIFVILSNKHSWHCFRPDCNSFPLHVIYQTVWLSGTLLR